MIIALRLVEIRRSERTHEETPRKPAQQPGKTKQGLEQAKGTEKEPEGNPQRRQD